ncbi:MAG TPA: hypothetical protein PKN64_18015, partial [Casimicrobium sp.]|nr:hypothetical protein [Casimicrobium sp.]
MQVTAAGDGTQMRTGSSTTAFCYGTSLTTGCPASSKVSVGQQGSVSSVSNSGGYEWLYVTWQSTGISAWSASGPIGSPNAWIAVIQPLPGAFSLTANAPYCVGSDARVNLSWTAASNATGGYKLFVNNLQVAGVSQ